MPISPLAAQAVVFAFLAWRSGHAAHGAMLAAAALPISILQVIFFFASGGPGELVSVFIGLYVAAMVGTVCGFITRISKDTWRAAASQAASGRSATVLRIG